MPEPLITKEEACRNARAVLARALGRIAADYAAGRLSPEDAAWVEEQQAKARNKAHPSATLEP